MNNGTEKRWNGLMLRILQLAQSGNGKAAKITVTILVDDQAAPVAWEVQRHMIEPKTASLSAILAMLPKLDNGTTIQETFDSQGRP